MEGVMGLFGSILGIAAQAQAQNDQKNLGYANLQETERENRSQRQLATSAHTDAEGNTIYYDPLLKKWNIKLSPQTKKIIDGQQTEQIASLTQDAPRNRAANIRKDNRSQSADADFQKAFTDYKYRPQKSEDDFIGDATREALIDRRAGSAEAASAVNRSLLRTGNGSNIGQVFRSARDADAEEFERTMLGAKRQGQKDFLSIGGASDAKAQQQLEFLRGIADDTSDSPVRFGDDNGRLTGESDSALSSLISTIGQGQQSRMSAMDKLIQIAGNSPDFSGLASSLGKIGGSFSGGAKATGPVEPDTGNGINPSFWETMGQMGYLTPSTNLRSGF